MAYLLSGLDVLPILGFDNSYSAMAQGPTRLAHNLEFNKYVKRGGGEAPDNRRSVLRPERRMFTANTDYLPTKWMASFSFSKQIESRSSVLSTMYSMTLTVHGLV